MIKRLEITLMRPPGAPAAFLVEPSENLVSRARSGDEEAFRFIFERYARPIISFIYDMIGERGAAEELAQETFVRAFKGLNSLQSDAQLSTWLFGIAKNVARESLRSRRRNQNLVELDHLTDVESSANHLQPDGHLLNKELSGVIQNALLSLDEDKRLVFSLKVLHHLSYDEITEITGFSIAKLKTDLHRAKAEMRRRIQPYLRMSDEV